MKKTYAIIGAMDQEIEEYLNHVEDLRKVELKGFMFYEGFLNNKNVVISKSGVGKVFASMTAQKIIDVYNPELIIFTGVAGALNPEYEIGDILVANDCMQHDMDVTALGFTIGTIPYTNYRVFTADQDLKNLALQVSNSHKVHEGRILTGDQFITHGNTARFKSLANDLEGDAIEMEGAAVGQVATINEVPFLIIRTISDKADSSAAVSFNDLLPIVAKNSYEIVNHILSNTL